MSPFQRLIFTDGRAAGLAALALAAGVFLVTTLRALRLDRARRDRLAALPLSDSPPRSSHEA
jgi:hypothetical protein